MVSLWLTNVVMGRRGGYGFCTQWRRGVGASVPSLGRWTALYSIPHLLRWAQLQHSASLRASTTSPNGYFEQRMMRTTRNYCPAHLDVTEHRFAMGGYNGTCNKVMRFCPVNSLSPFGEFEYQYAEFVLFIKPFPLRGKQVMVKWLATVMYELHRSSTFDRAGLE